MKIKLFIVDTKTRHDIYRCFIFNERNLFANPIKENTIKEISNGVEIS